MLKSTRGTGRLAWEVIVADCGADPKRSYSMLRRGGMSDASPEAAAAADDGLFIVAGLVFLAI